MHARVGIATRSQEAFDHALRTKSKLARYPTPRRDKSHQNATVPVVHNDYGQLGDGSMARAAHAPSAAPSLRVELDRIRFSALTTPIENTIRELFATETANARSVLSQDRDRDTAVKLTFGAGQRADRKFLPVFQSVACKPGCGFCCRGVRVDATAPEALTIVRGFREAMSKEHVAVIAAHVKRHAALVRSMTLEERYRERVPCPMLDQTSDRCLVHDARPMNCRAHHSLDATACEAAILHPGERRGIPRYPDVMNAHEAMILGQRKALAAAKLDNRSFDLSLALEVAFEHENAAERWANGERVFDAAVFAWPDEEPPDESAVPKILLSE